MTIGELKQIIENMDDSIPFIINDCDNNYVDVKSVALIDVSINASHRYTSYEPGGNDTVLLVSR